MQTDDIDGAQPNAFGKVSAIKGRDYMQVEDIPGAKSRYLEQSQLRDKLAKAREKDFLDVRDINEYDRRSKRL